MPDRQELLGEARKDIDACLTIWSELLEEFLGDRLNYAYAKGSSVKTWTSTIDYVPILSDVDVHVSTTDGDLSKSFDEALMISQRYEEAFKSERTDHLHIPRMQLISMKRLIENANIDYVPPLLKNVRVLNGKPKQEPIPDIETIRQIDRRSTVRQEEFVNSLPYNLIDKSGLDFWALIRCGGLGWRVGPAPYRIMTQIYPEPIEVWSWNRTTLLQELGYGVYKEIAKHYKSFYDSCWGIFLSDFKSTEEYRNVVRHGYRVLKLCLESVKETEEDLNITE